MATRNAKRSSARSRSPREQQPSWDPEGYRYSQANQTTQAQSENVSAWASDRESNMPTTWVYEEYAWWAEPGPYEGIGPRGYTRSDDDIYRDVCNRLAQNGQLDASDIEVSVNDQEVTLKGNVDHRQNKRLAEDIADSVTGVQDVHNELRVRRQGQTVGQMSSQARASTIPEKPAGLKDGQEVMGAKGQSAGKVKEIHAHDFVLDRSMAPDVHVPFSAIQDVSRDRVMLNVPTDQIDRQNWTHI